MATHVETREQRFLTYTDWNGYLQCRAALDDTGVRITYDEGRMELMSPSPEHEQGKSDLGFVLEVYLTEREIDFAIGGNPTMRKQSEDKGLEPDECYYLGSHAHGRLGPAPPGLNINPPNLVLEVEVTRSALNRLKLFAAMGVQEVWRYDYDEHRIAVHSLQSDGSYSVGEKSPLLPELPVQRLTEFVRRGQEVITSQLTKEVRAWVRSGCPSA